MCAINTVLQLRRHHCASYRMMGSGAVRHSLQNCLTYVSSIIMLVMIYATVALNVLEYNGL